MSTRDKLWLAIGFVLTLGPYIDQRLTTPPTTWPDWVRFVFGGLVVMAGSVRLWLIGNKNGSSGPFPSAPPPAGGGS